MAIMGISDEQFAQIQLARSHTIGPVAFAQLLKRYGSATQALKALPGLKNRVGKAPKLASVKSVEDEIASVKKLDAQYLFITQDDYPDMLRHLSNPPPILIAKGQVDLLSTTSIAIVGARNSSAAAKKLAYKLGYELAERGITVVSGLARGIDSEAHKGAIKATQTNTSDGQREFANTIGVIASGIDIIYPPENSDLQTALSQNGLVITEYPPGSEPVARHFPFRNRIIAGLSLATLVVEAAPRSGSLITTRLANELGREVLAVPGSPLDSRSAGCNGLIREGATLVRNVDDIVEAISPLLSDYNQAPNIRSGHNETLFRDENFTTSDVTASTAIISNDAQRENIRNQLSQVAISPDELAILAECSIATVNAALVELEIMGECERVAGGKVKGVFDTIL